MSAADKSPAVSPFDDALRLMPGPVAVIGVAGDETAGGLTAAWVTRVSMDPVLLLVSIGHTRFTWELLSGTTEFTVSVLADGQVPEARLFGLNSRRDVDKWSQVDHVVMGDRTPALERCTARYLCKLQDRFTTGDHDCIIGRVTAAEVVDGPPALPLRAADYAPA